MDLPDLVSCLMVTRAARMELAARAIECFRRQGYSEKELVVVSQDDVSALGVPFHVAPKELTLGDLRNFAVARARGTIIAQWDDDDWYHPERLERQVGALIADGKAVGCTLARWTMAWPAKSRYAIAAPQFFGYEGSIVAWRWRMPLYPPLPRREDTALMCNISVVTLDAPELYVYQVHYANTWNEEHFDALFARGQALDGESARAVETRVTA